MCKKIEQYWNSLDRMILVNKRELVLGLAACTLAGVVAGILLSPRKNVTIGSNNGNNSGNSAGLPASDEQEEAAEQEVEA